MTIEIEKPELEALIQRRVLAGNFGSIEDMLLETLGGISDHDAEADSKRAPGRRSLAQLFAESPLKGCDLTLERDSDPGRPVDL